MPRIGLLFALFALALPSTASAQETVPTDIAFLQLGTVCERISVDVYTAALARGEVTADQREALTRSRASDRRQLKKLATGLGPLTSVAFDRPIAIPNPLVDSPGAAMETAERLTRLTIGVYLYTASLVADPRLRALLSRYAAADIVTLQRIRKAAGKPPVAAAAGRGTFPPPWPLIGAGPSELVRAIGV